MQFLSHNGDGGKIWNIPFWLLFMPTFLLRLLNLLHCGKFGEHKI